MLDSLKQAMQGQNPKSKIKAGYAQISQKGKIKPLCDLQAGEEFELCDGVIEAKARLLDSKSNM